MLDFKYAAHEILGQTPYGRRFCRHGSRHGTIPYSTQSNSPRGAIAWAGATRMGSQSPFILAVGLNREKNRRLREVMFQT
jgi:hypothetical protein